MALGRPLTPIVLSEEHRQQLSSIANSRSLPHSLVLRAQLVLLASAGFSNNQIAARLKLCKETICRWRKSYRAHGIEGLHDAFKSGRPRTVSDDAVALVVRETLETKPKNGTHWSVRLMGNATHVSRASVHRIWQAFGLQPHRQEHFTLSNDPFFMWASKIGERIWEIACCIIRSRTVGMPNSLTPPSGFGICLPTMFV